MNKLISYTHFYDLYALLIFICLFIIVPFGVFPAALSFHKKLEIKEALVQEESRLDQAIRDARDMRYQNEDVTPYLISLNRAIPTGFSGEDFVMEVLSLTAGNGFLLKSINISPNETENFTPVSVLIEGDFANMKGLVLSMEDSHLSIIIDSFTASFSPRSSSSLQSISVSLRVFSLPEMY